MHARTTFRPIKWDKVWENYPQINAQTLKLMRKQINVCENTTRVRTFLEENSLLSIMIENNANKDSVVAFPQAV